MGGGIGVLPHHPEPVFLPYLIYIRHNRIQVLLKTVIALVDTHNLIRNVSYLKLKRLDYIRGGRRRVAHLEHKLS